MSHWCDSLEDPVRMFLLSDIHVVAVEDDRRDSLVHTFAGGETPSPLEELHTLIASEEITSDVLVCCGDLTNKANAVGLQNGWSRVEELADQLSAQDVVFSPGNHDVDSRNNSGSGQPFVFIEPILKSPRLPTRLTDHRLVENSFELYEIGGLVAVNLNSNGPAPDETEGYRGIAHREAIVELEAELRGFDHQPLYLMFCHHHPIRHGDIDAEDYSEMENAPELINMMARFNQSHWILIHGHKHHPRIRAISENVTAFSAGAVGGTFGNQQATVSRNQCYEIVIGTDPRLGQGHPPVCRYRAWDWAATRWIPAVGVSPIPRVGGIGHPGHPTLFAARIRTALDESQGGVLAASEVLTRCPELNYLLPTQLDGCLAALHERHGVRILADQYTGEWVEFGIHDE